MEDRIKKLIEDMQSISADIEGGDYWNTIDKEVLKNLYEESLRIGDITFCLKEE